MSQRSYEQEVVDRLLRALGDLWHATDYPEATMLSLYTDEELKAILGQWIHIRRVGDALFNKIRESRPDLPGWTPILGERPVDEI